MQAGCWGAAQRVAEAGTSVSSCGSVRCPRDQTGGGGRSQSPSEAAPSGAGPLLWEGKAAVRGLSQ